MTDATTDLYFSIVLYNRPIWTQLFNISMTRWYQWYCAAITKVFPLYSSLLNNQVAIGRIFLPFLLYCNEMKWNESALRPPLCTYSLTWARRTSWMWWDEWDDTVLQTQDSKFEPWRSEAEHATSRSRRLPTILSFTRVCTLRSSVCAYTLLRRVLIHADCKWPSPTPSTTLPLYEMITCFI